MKPYLLLATCLLGTALSAASPTVSAGSIAIPLHEITMLTHNKIIERSPDFVAAETLRGASNTVALILNGLAQTCAQVGNALGTASQNPLPPIVLNTVATSLATAAAIVIDKKQQREQKKQSHTKLAKALTDFALRLEQAEQHQDTRMPNTMLFSVLANIKSPLNKEAFITLLLNENDNELANEFVQDLIDVAESYFTNHEDALVEAVKICAGVVFINWLEQQSPSKEPSEIPLANLNDGGLILYTPSQTGEEIPALINQIASTVTQRLLAMYAAMANSAL